MIPTVSRRLLPAATLLMVVLAACSSGASTTPLPSGAEPPSDCARVEDGVIALSAAGPGVQRAVPGSECRRGVHHPLHQQRFDVPHNVAVLRTTAKANEIMRGEIENGPGETCDYDVEALDAGQYYFDCTGAPPT